MKKSIVTITLASLMMISGMTFTGCKKGANDPALSLKSRKGRLAGDWKLVKVEGTSKSYFTSGNSSSLTVTNYSYDGTTMTENSTNTLTMGGNSTSSTSTTVYPYSIDATFDKKGYYKMVTNDNGDIITSEGSWAFIGRSKNADLKNKEAIAMSEEKYSNTGNNSTSTTEGEFYFGADMVYILDKLSSKELIVKMKYKTTYGDGDYYDYDWTMTFEKK